MAQAKVTGLAAGAVTIQPRWKTAAGKTLNQGSGDDYISRSVVKVTP